MVKQKKDETNKTVGDNKGDDGKENVGTEEVNKKGTILATTIATEKERNETERVPESGPTEC